MADNFAYKCEYVYANENLAGSLTFYRIFPYGQYKIWVGPLEWNFEAYSLYCLLRHIFLWQMSEWLSEYIVNKVCLFEVKIGTNCNQNPIVTGLIVIHI